LTKKAERINLRGLQDMRDGNYAAAAGHFTEAVKREPGNGTYRYNLGLAYYACTVFENSDYEKETIDNLRIAEKKKIASASAMLGTLADPSYEGRAYRRFKDEALAIDFYQKAAERFEKEKEDLQEPEQCALYTLSLNRIAAYFDKKSLYFRAACYAALAAKTDPEHAGDTHFEEYASHLSQEEAEKASAVESVQEIYDACRLSDGQEEDKEGGVRRDLAIGQAIVEHYRSMSHPEPKENVEEEDRETLEELLARLDEMVDLEVVKKDLKSLINLMKANRLRAERGIETPMPVVSHMIFTGNPGTGKTTVARLVARIYRKLGILEKGHLVEVERADLVSTYIGGTEEKVREKILQAKGGVLFIDEAYNLAGKGKKDFGNDVIDTLIKSMEDARSDYVVIAAGYPDLMESFLDANPGLRSRFGQKIHFPDYAPESLVKIFEYMASKGSIRLEEGVREELLAYFTAASGRKGFANAREARNLLERSLRSQADRLSGLENPSDEMLMTLTLEDIRACMGPKGPEGPRKYGFG